MCDVRYVMQDVLDLKKVDFVLSEAVILDYYVTALWWAAKEQKFTKEQISAFYNVVNTLLDNIRGTGKQSLVKSISFSTGCQLCLKYSLPFCRFSFLPQATSC